MSTKKKKNLYHGREELKYEMRISQSENATLTKSQRILCITNLPKDIRKYI